MLKAILHFSDMAADAAGKGVSADKIMKAAVRGRLARMKEVREHSIDGESKAVTGDIDTEFGKMVKEEAIAEEKVSE